MPRHYPDTFMEMVVKEIPALQRYSCVLSRDRFGRDDLVQDCLERALRNADRFEPGTNLRSWLFTILRNTYIDGYRKERRRGVQVDVNDCIGALSTPAAQPAAVELNWTLAEIGGLNQRDRTIIELAVLEDLPHRDIADRLGIAVGTVKSRLSRARCALAAAPHVPVQRRPAQSH